MSSRNSITGDNRSALISIVVWTTMVATVITVIVKLGTKWIISKRFEMDDYSVSAALLFAVGYNIATSIAASNGLGQHITELSGDQILRVQRANYASDIFYGISVCLSKIPVLYFLICIARGGYRARFVYATIILNTIWMVVSIFVTAFQCQTPNTWMVFSSECLNMEAFWNTFGAMDILIDCAIVVLPIYLLHDLHIKLGRKVSVLMAFALRLITIPLVVVRLVFLAREASSTDQTFDSTNTVIVTALHVNMSTIVACSPFFKPILEAMSPGLFQGGLGTLMAIRSEVLNSMELSASAKHKYSLSDRYRSSRGGISTVISSGGRGNNDRDTESTEQMMIRRQTDMNVSETRLE